MLATMRNEPVKAVQGVLPDDVRALVDRIFDQLLSSCPAMRSQFDEKQLNLAKRTWVLAFAENGIKTMEQVKAGMRKVRSKPDDFFPSVGRFISWCHEVNYDAFGLSDVESLYERLQRFQCFGMAEAYKFKFKSHAEYYVLTDVYCYCRENQCSVDEAKARLKMKLQNMIERLINGEVLAEPKIALPPKASFIPAEKQREINLKGAGLCRNALRGGV